MLRPLLGLSLLALVALIAGFRPSSAPGVARAATTPFALSGLQETFTVPAGVTRVRIEVAGGTGGTSCGGVVAGGAPVAISGIFSVTPGQTLYVHVGGPGAASTAGGTGGVFGGGAGGVNNLGVAFNAGGGGGATDVRTLPDSNPGTLGSRLITSGGGGGAGGCGGIGTGGVGGSVGGTKGGDGTGGAPGTGGTSGAFGGGGGAASAAGGVAGTPGTAGLGGIGGSSTGGSGPGGTGGGGGGGQLGGGGGGSEDNDHAQGGGGGGGAGSNFIDPAATAAAGNTLTASAARITTLDPPVVSKTFNPGSILINGTSTLVITVTNPASNNIPGFSTLTGISLTDDVSAAGLTIEGPITNTCGGTIPASTTQIAMTGGTLTQGASCTITATVRAATAGTHINRITEVRSNESGITAINVQATLAVGVPATNTATNTPTATATPVIVAPPVIPQVFQHVPQGIFTGPRNNTPTPVVRAIVAPVIGLAAIPVLRPPSTGDAGLLRRLSLPAAW